MIYFHEYETPVGLLTIGSFEQDIVLCHFGKITIDGIYQENAYLHAAHQQLMEYFAGQRKIFQLSYRFLNGTPFQQTVWNALLEIPYGMTVSYRDIAIKVGAPKAYRAVGSANHCNPIVIFVPCHRVIGTHHQFVGYAGGLDKKKYLLDLEKAL